MDESQDRLFQIYSENKNFDEVEKILDEQQKDVIEIRDTSGRNFLMYASSFGDEKSIDYLLHKGIDVQATDNFGNTALMFACSFHQLGAIKKLIDFGADISAKNKHGDECFKFVTLKGFTDQIEEIIKENICCGIKPARQD